MDNINLNSINFSTEHIPVTVVIMRGKYSFIFQTNIFDNISRELLSTAANVDGVTLQLIQVCRLCEWMHFVVDSIRLWI